MPNPARAAEAMRTFFAMVLAAALLGCGAAKAQAPSISPGLLLSARLRSACRMRTAHSSGSACAIEQISVMTRNDFKLDE
jgi:hypothetical protein